MAKSNKQKTINKKTDKNMAESKKETAKAVKVIKKLRQLEDVTAGPVSLQESKRQPFGLWIKLILVIAIGSVLYLVAQKYRGSFIAGTVNSTPISRWELNRRLVDKYGKQTFDDMVNEKLLAQEIKKNNITVTEQEVSDEVAKIVQEYGGEEAFKSALTQYGLTEAKARESIRQSLSLKKVIEKSYQITITDDQIKKYFNDNKTLFTGKKFEAVQADIKESLYQQEIYTKSQEWFGNVRNTAKIVSFI